jgi:multidrug resistance efflux pump
MYVERETGGFARGTIIAGDAEKIWDAKAAKTPAEPDPEPAQALEGPSRQDQKHFNEPPAQRVQLPAKIAIETASGAARARSSKTRKLAMLGAVLLAVGATGTFGYRWWTVGRFIEATDDAYVSAHNTTLAAKVAGYVSNIAVEDNSHVRAGDVIATIDDGDFALAVNAARNKVATQQATVERIGRQIVAQQASVEQARAQLVSAQAGATRMRLELDRQQALAQREYASRQTLEQAQSNRDQGAAAVQSAQAALDAADATVDVLKAQQQEAAKTLEELRTALAKAERDLSFTVIRAPVDGVIGNRAVQTGDFVQTGQAPREPSSARRRLCRRQLQGDAAGPSAPRTDGRDHGRRAARPGDRRHHHVAGARFRSRVLAAASRQCDRQFHQDRAAPAGAHQRAARRRHAPRAAARHVGRGQREHQAGRGRGAGAHRLGTSQLIINRFPAAETRPCR